MDGEHRRRCLSGTGHQNGDHGQWVGAGLLEGNGQLGRAELLLKLRAGERKAASWAGGSFGPWPLGKMKKAFLSLKSFLNSEAPKGIFIL
jgi:hypothetical protein